MNFGPLELGVILIVVLVIFGPKRLPQLGRSLGGGMREFKDAVTGNSKDEDPAIDAAPAPVHAPTAQPVVQTPEPPAIAPSRRAVT
jgi:sec-independent protein translocase protein TatA